MTSVAWLQKSIWVSSISQASLWTRRCGKKSQLNQFLLWQRRLMLDYWKMAKSSPKINKAFDYWCKPLLSLWCWSQLERKTHIWCLCFLLWLPSSGKHCSLEASCEIAVKDYWHKHKEVYVCYLYLLDLFILGINWKTTNTVRFFVVFFSLWTLLKKK